MVKHKIDALEEEQEDLKQAMSEFRRDFKTELKEHNHSVIDAINDLNDKVLQIYKHLAVNGRNSDDNKS